MFVLHALTCVLLFKGDPFRVVHQSPTTVLLPSTDSAIPLYCIASGHTLDYKYQWDITMKLPGNSPVIWVNEATLYCCSVVHNSTNAQCSSRTIHVIEEENSKRCCKGFRLDNDCLYKF